MKKMIMIVTLLAVSQVFASENAGGNNKPCLEVKKACEAAGFAKGKHKEGDKGLHKDCMQKLANGETVEGVTVSADVIAACKQKREDHKERKAKK